MDLVSYNLINNVSNYFHQIFIIAGSILCQDTCLYCEDDLNLNFVSGNCIKK
jgi:hypothetical protein